MNFTQEEVNLRSSIMEIKEEISANIIQSYKVVDDKPLATIFTPDDKFLIIGSIKGFITLWTTAFTTKVRSIKGHDSSIQSIAISQDGDTFVTGSDDRSIKGWDLTTFEKKFELLGHNDQVSSVLITADQKYIISGSKDSSIKVWDLDSRYIKFNLTDFQGSELSVSDNGKILIGGTSDYKLAIWSLETKKIEFTLPGHTSNIFSVKFLKHNRFACSLDYDSNIMIWDLILRTSIIGLNKLTGWIYSNEEKILFAACCNQSVKVWNLRNKKQVLNFSGQYQYANLSNASGNRKMLAMSSENQTIKLWNLSS